MTFGSSPKLFSARNFAADIESGRARRVDFAKEPTLRPGLRTWGTGLPGYCSGWFTLAGGRGLRYFTRRDKAVYVPTTQGFGLLLTPDDLDGFLQALRGQDHPNAMLLG